MIVTGATPLAALDAVAIDTETTGLDARNDRIVQIGLPNDTNSAVFGSANQTKSQFAISAGAKAFRVLSSNIYKNKVRACVRELVCNAVDAHVINNQTKPFLVKAPNKIDQTFSVRDYGPGLNDEDMVELYTTYFASSKDDRNDQIGCFGLGSKSPFAYTSTFSVTSYHDGWVRSYQCMLSNGEPMITKTFEGLMADEESGIEVVVPVKTDDIDAWEREIEYVMRPFASDSYVIKGAHIDVQSFDKLSNYSDDWFKGDGSLYGYSYNSLYAVYGNIVYPLNGIVNTNGLWLTATSHAIFIHFELGELDMQPSREELSLDDVTVANIKKRILGVSSKYKAKQIAHLKDQTTKRELARAIKKLATNKQAILRSTPDLKFGEFTAKDAFDVDYLPLYKTLVENYVGVYEYSFGSVLTRRVIAEKPRYKSVRVSQVLAETLVTLSKNKFYLIVKDDKKAIRTTIKGLIASTDDNTPDKDDYIIVVDQINPNHTKVIDVLKQYLENDELFVFKSSECEVYRKLVPGYGVKKTKADLATVKPKAPNAVKYTLKDDGRYWSIEDLFLSSKEIEEVSGYVYGKYFDDLAVKVGDTFKPIVGYSVQSLRDHLANAGITEVTMVRSSMFAKIANNPNCIDAFTLVYDDFMQTFDKVNDDAYAYYDRNDYGTRTLRHCHAYMPTIKNYLMGKKVTADSFALNDLIKKFDDVRGHGVDLAYNIQEKITHYKENVVKSEKIYDENMEKLKKEYPFVGYYLSTKLVVCKEKAALIDGQFKALLNTEV